MFTAFNSETPANVSSQTVDEMCGLDVFAFDLKYKKVFARKTEVECIEARTRIKTGAPVCSGSPIVFSIK